MDINTKFKYWLTVAQAAHFKLERYERPAFIGDKATPSTFNWLTIGQLIELSELGDEDESIYRIVEITMQIQRKDIDEERAVDVVRYVGWAFGEVERINKLFKSFESKPTAKEKRAGVDTLEFGLFGMLDWYALRMGIEDHDEVLKVPWLRIYKCMDMDKKRQEYEKKLQQIAAEEMRNETRRRQEWKR